MLVLYALINGPGLARALLGGSSPRWWAGYAREGVAAGAAQVRRLLALATVSGLVGLAAAYAFGLPGKSVLAIWVGVWAVVPIFGPVIGYAPMVVLASLDGWPQAIGDRADRRRRVGRQLVRRPARTVTRAASAVVPAPGRSGSPWRS